MTRFSLRQGHRGHHLPRVVSGAWSTAAAIGSPRTRGRNRNGGRRRLCGRRRGGRAFVPVALRAAAGAALPLLHGRRFGRTISAAAAVASQSRRAQGAPRVFARLRARLLHRVRGARCGRLDDRPAAAGLAGAAGHRRRRAHHRDGAEFPRRAKNSAAAREARFHSSGRPASAVAAYVMGLAFAFGWTPCIGPVLGPILTLAGGRETVGEGALLLAAYSLGLGIPFLVAALFSGAFMRSCTFPRPSRACRKSHRRLAGRGRRAVPHRRGSSASYWILETFPALQRLG